MNFLLGKIDGYKVKIDDFRPFGGHILREMQAFYRIGLVYSSNAIEGSTYTMSETKVLLEDGLTAGGRPLRDALAVIGHAKAYDHMFSLLHAPALAEADLKRFHMLLEGGLEGNCPAGQYRNQPVFITGSAYPVTAHADVPLAMKNLFTEYGQRLGVEHPVLLAAWLHKELVFIHPFVDGNGRVARLALITVLIQNGYTPACISPVLRSEYIDKLELARRDERPFLKFICECVLEAQKELLRMLVGEQHDSRPSGPFLD